jgi:FlaA1/EpsC-like NDP-sugar epimerase
VPGEDIDIRFTGVRPGEKLFEELRTEGEDIEATMHPKVLVWRHAPVPWTDVESAIEKLSALANCPHRVDVVRALQEIVPEYQPPSAKEPAKPATAGPPPKTDAAGKEAMS